MNDASIAAQLKHAVESGYTMNALAAQYGVYATDIWRAVRKGYVSPALRRAVDPPRKRTRIIKETTPAVKEWWDRYIVSDNDLMDMIMTHCDVNRYPYPEDLP